MCQVHPVFRLSKDSMAFLIALVRQVVSVLDAAVRSMTADAAGAGVATVAMTRQAFKGVSPLLLVQPVCMPRWLWS